MPAECYPCGQEATFDRLPPRERVAYDEHWRVAHAFGTALPGWLVLVPRRHVSEISELTDAESATLGSWQTRLARALTAELGVRKVYLASFGELPGFHLHFHVVPRPLDLDRELRGPGVFELLGRDDDTQVGTEVRDQLAERLAGQLRWGVSIK